jgi:hypothetical protein
MVEVEMGRRAMVWHLNAGWRHYLSIHLSWADQVVLWHNHLLLLVLPLPLLEVGLAET